MERSDAGKAVTVGTFDGVHRGHQAVLAELRRCAERHALEPMVVTFDRHPLETVCPARAPKLIMEPAERDRLLARHGVEVRRVAFTESVRGMSCREWMRSLRDDLRMRVLVLGHDNTFGSDGREMDEASYLSIGRDLGIEVVKAPVVGECSSSRVRRVLEAGDVKEAAHLLGRHFELKGTVAEGRRIGRTIGFPTANVQPAVRQIVPASGVYAAIAVTSDGRRYPAVVNIGAAPTVTDKGEVRVEAHLVGFDGDLYGQTLRLEFLARLRGERKFPSLAALKQAIQTDIENMLVELANFL